MTITTTKTTPTTLMPFSTGSGADLEPHKSVSDAQLLCIIVLSTDATCV